MEKIKTIGSSYMVAAGITPGIESGDKLHVIKTRALLETCKWASYFILDFQRAALCSHFDWICISVDGFTGSN